MPGWRRAAWTSMQSCLPAQVRGASRADAGSLHACICLPVPVPAHAGVNSLPRALPAPGKHLDPGHTPFLLPLPTAAAGAGLSLLPCLTDADLRELGIPALGARKKLLLAAEELAEAAEAAGAAGGSGDQAGGEERRQDEPPGTPGQQQQPRQQQGQLEERRQSHARARVSGVGDWRALAAGAGGAAVSCSILQYFKPQGGGKQAEAVPNPGSILSYLKAADGSSLAGRAAKQAAAGQGAGPGRGRGGKPAAQQWAHKAVAAASGGAGGGKRWGPRRVGGE